MRVHIIFVLLAHSLLFFTSSLFLQGSVTLTLQLELLLLLDGGETCFLGLLLCFNPGLFLLSLELTLFAFFLFTSQFLLVNLFSTALLNFSRDVDLFVITVSIVDGGDVQDAVGIYREGDIDLGDTFSSRYNTTKSILAEQRVVRD